MHKWHWTRPVLMLVTEPSPRLPEIILAALTGGVDMVQWRDKTTPAEGLAAQGESIRLAVTPPARLIVNLSHEIGRPYGADGVHLPSDKRVPRHEPTAVDLLLGRSVHTIDEAINYANDADYLIAGTIFASQSHPGIEPAGLEFLRLVCQTVTVPVLAIGGITPKNAPDCLAAGATGVAVLSPIMRAADPAGMAAVYRMALDNSGEL